MKTLITILLFAFFTLPSQAQIITTVAGDGTWGMPIDGTQTLSTSLDPGAITIDKMGNIYVTDGLMMVFKIDTSMIIHRYAGNLSTGFSGDNGPATDAVFNMPLDITIDDSGNLYIADTGNYRIRKITQAGVIKTIAGTGTRGYSGDGGAATLADITIYHIAIDRFGNLIFSDGFNHIRKINTDGYISTIAGDGTATYSGDGRMATATSMQPLYLANDYIGNILFIDGVNIRKINVAGIVTTIAGNGMPGYGGDGGQATDALINANGLAVDSAGNIYFSDLSNRVRKVGIDGIVNTIAGNGIAGFSGDRGPATSAELKELGPLSIDTRGNIYICDIGNNRVRKIGGPNSAKVQQIAQQQSFAIFPNPNNGIFTILMPNVTNAEIAIVDLLGREVKSDM